MQLRLAGFGIIFLTAVMSTSTRADVVGGLPFNISSNETVPVAIAREKPHVLKRHVRDMAYLKRRCDKTEDPVTKSASTFNSASDAEILIDDTIASFTYAVDADLAAGRTSTLNNYPRWGNYFSNTGWSLDCATRKWTYSGGLRVIVKPHSNARGGWYVVTAYPIWDGDEAQDADLW